ncbi:twin-arginine translocation signal domain-containing protein [Roseomonas sp. M0104]|uniref:Twin-arginine translocation signal domain-containing protein n=1 Tax=Teichococcus coralli TaxID=2545983 RepID=A0A845BCS1_9PROT|nr:twin-arginine translocation signal domain-containing protein [Pseudoroseomonas coralli]MXP64931.1 twin-arginine translocation signal domain-containing protein [Pseudoroseomonas coralli]
MSDREDAKVAERRGFLKTLGLAGGAAVAAKPALAIQERAPEQRKESETQKVAARYRETEHVKAYYRTNRY